MKRILTTSLLLSAAALLSTSCTTITKPNVTINEPDLDAIVFEDFSKGETKFFSASNGYSNGSVFDSTWSSENVGYANGEMTLSITKGADKRYGSELRTIDKFHYGDYSVKMKPMKVDGTASTFFTYTGPHENNPWDEIDIEFLGKDTTKVQFNYFTNGVGGHEYMYDLGFDASLEYHEYGFRWTSTAITWFVDKKPVYQATKDIPQTAGSIFMNAWNGTEEAEAWMGKLPADFEKGTAYYEEIGFKSIDGKPYEPQFELPPEYNIEEAKWVDLDATFESTDIYTATKNGKEHNITYTNAKNNTYSNIFTALPEDAKKANAIKFDVTNNGTKDVELRIDVNQAKQVGNTRDITILARDNGNALTTNFEWGGSATILKAGKTTTIDLVYEGAAVELMFMIDSFNPGDKVSSGDITIKNMQLGTYGKGQEVKPDTPVTPTPDTDTYHTLPLTFNSDTYTVENGNDTYHVTYTDVIANCYKNIASSLPAEAKTATKIQFKIKNNGTKTVKGRVDVNQAEKVGKTKCINKSATQDGAEIRTDSEWGGSFFDLAAGQESVIKVTYAGEAVEFMLMLDSHMGTEVKSSGDLTISEVKINKEITNTPVEPQPEPQPQPETPTEGTAIDPTFGTGEAKYIITKDANGTNVKYEGIKNQTYGCINASIEFGTATTISFKVKNNGTEKIDFKFDVINAENKSINDKATFNGNEIFTDKTHGGSQLALEAGVEGTVVITFVGTGTGLNIFLDSGWADPVLTHNGDATFSNFIIK